MSKAPKGDAPPGKLPTGAVYAKPSFTSSQLSVSPGLALARLAQARADGEPTRGDEHHRGAGLAPDRSRRRGAPRGWPGSGVRIGGRRGGGEDARARRRGRRLRRAGPGGWPEEVGKHHAE